MRRVSAVAASAGVFIRRRLVGMITGNPFYLSKVTVRGEGDVAPFNNLAFDGHLERT